MSKSLMSPSTIVRAVGIAAGLAIGIGVVVGVHTGQLPWSTLVVAFVLCSFFLVAVRLARRKVLQPSPMAAAVDNMSKSRSWTVPAQVISRSCTTGWSDWRLGALLVSDLGLVRITLAQPPEAGMRLQNTVPEANAAGWVPDERQAVALREADPTFRYVTFAEIARAQLHRGIVSDRLTVSTHSGQVLKFSWLKADPAYAVLTARLPTLISSPVQFN